MSKKIKEERKQLRPLIQQAVEERIGLAMSLAASFHYKSKAPVPLDDLESAACYGLMLAAHRYDAYCAEKGYDADDLSYFSVYCTKRIKGEMIEYLRDLDWVSRATRTKQKLLNEIELEEKNNLSTDELAWKAGLTVDQVRNVRNLTNQSPVTLETVNPDSTFVDYSQNLHQDYVEDSTTEALLTKTVVKTIEEFNLVERLAIVHRYYLKKTIASTAEAIGLSPADTTKILHQCLRRIKQNVVEVFDLDDSL